MISRSRSLPFRCRCCVVVINSLMSSPRVACVFPIGPTPEGTMPVGPYFGQNIIPRTMRSPAYRRRPACWHGSRLRVARRAACPSDCQLLAAPARHRSAPVALPLPTFARANVTNRRLCHPDQQLTIKRVMRQIPAGPLFALRSRRGGLTGRASPPPRCQVLPRAGVSPRPATRAGRAVSASTAAGDGTARGAAAASHDSGA
jgi:hypothetical protein